MRKQSLSRKIILAYSLLAALAASLLTSGLYWQLRTVQRQAMQDRLLELLRLSAPQIDSDYLALTVNPGSMKEPFYKINQERLQNIQAAVPSIIHIYTLRQQADDQFVFILDCPGSNRFIAPVGTRLQQLTPRLKAGMTSLNQPIVESDLLINSLGTPVLYGYAPIKNQFGRINGILVIELNASSIIQSELQVGAIAVGIFGLVLLLTLIVIWWLSQSLVTRPILQLTQASKRIASGQWNQLLPTDRADELGDLAASFNTMAQQLQGLFATLEQRVQERTIALQESEEKFRQLAENINHVFSIEDTERHVLYTSPSYEEIWGYPVETLYQNANAWLDAVHPDDRDRVLTELPIIQEHDEGEMEYRITRPNGEIRWIRDRSFPIRNAQGDVYRIAGLAEDITEQKLAEAEIRRSKDLFEAIFQESADAIFLVDTDSILILDCNQRAVELFEADSKQTLIGIKEYTLHKVPWTEEEAVQIHLEALQQGIWTQEVEYCTLKGHYFWGNLASKQIHVAGRQMSLIRVTDISDRKVAEVALRQSEVRLKLALEAFPTVVWEVDLQTDRLLFISSRTGRLIPGEISRSDHKVLMVHPDDQMLVEQSYQNALVHCGTFQLEHRHRSESPPEWQWVQVNGTVQVDAAGNPTRVVGITFDIHDRKQAELKLQHQAEADQLLVAITQTISQSIHLHEVLDTCLEQIRQFFHCERALICRFDRDYNIVIEQESVSQPELSLLSQTIEDPCFDRTWAERYRQGYITVCCDARSGDGLPCYAELLNQLQVRANLVVGILQADQIWGLLIIHQCYAPRQWQSFEIDLLKQLGLNIGIASQKASLYMQLESQLAQKEVLLKEVHHRVKNNLQVISSMLRLQAKAAGHSAVFSALEDTRNRLQAMALIHETLYQSNDLRQLNFHDYIKRLTGSILAAHSTLPNQITLIYHLQPIVFNLETAIPCGLLLNELVTNAIKHAFPDDQTGTVSITFEQLLPLNSEPTASRSLAAQNSAGDFQQSSASPCYVLTIQDDGVGIPVDLDLKQLKSLGLKIAYDLALQLRGTLELERTSGTRFQLTFSPLEYRKRL